MPISEYPEVVPPSVVVRAQYPGRQPEGHRRDGRDADRGGGERRRGHALHGQPGDDRRPDDADRHLRARHRSGQGAAAGAEPRGAGRAAPAGGGAPARHHHGQELARPDDGRAPAVAERPLRHDLPAQLRPPERQGPARAGRGHRPGRAVRRRRLLDARLARPAEGRRARPLGRRRRRRDPGAERAGRRRRRRRLAGAARPRLPALDQRAGPARERGGVRRHHRQDRSERRGHPAARHRADRARRRRVRAALAARQPVRGGDRHLPGAGLERARHLRRGARGDGRAEDGHARRRRLRDRLRPDAVHPSPRSRRWSRRCSRRWRWW